MFDPKVRIRRSLYGRLKRLAAAKGYSSVDEMVVHVLEIAASEAAEEVAEDAVRKRLQGLGYIK